MPRLNGKRPRPSIAIIGGGFGGIGMAIRLKMAGFDRITVLEKASGPGGTWWHNTYPGAEVDTPSILYSYSFMPWRWTRSHVRQRELQEYIEAAIERYDVARHIRYGTTVDRVVWDDEHRNYSVVVDGRELLRADHVVSAVGLLSDPKMPDWDGLDDFRGPVVHAAQWDHSLDLSGKRVAVVGSGSTAAQAVPALSNIAAQVLMFQREPGWVVPKNARDYTPAERRALGSGLAQRLMRFRYLWEREKTLIGRALWLEGSAVNTAARKIATDFIAREFADRPDLAEAVTPSYVYAGKRPIISDELYPALKKDNVTLVPRAVKGLTSRGLLDADGEEHEVDAVVLATGFKADFLTTLDVVGRGGRSLHDVWGGEDTAFLGIMPSSTPNFFMLYGPNTNGGTIVTHLELQIQYVVSAITHAWRRGASSIEIKPWALDRYDRTIQGRLAGTTFQFENNYYRSASGRISTQWPDGAMTYGALTKLLRRPLWKLERRAGASNGRPARGASIPTNESELS